MHDMCHLANTIDPNCFMQTLLGLACYAQDLRDKGFKLLNALGVTCSIFHIRQYDNWWAKMHDAMKEILVYGGVTIRNYCMSTFGCLCITFWLICSTIHGCYRFVYMCPDPL